MHEQLTTIELRLNEGTNLNRRKVQKIVGGSIRRKPVHCQSRTGRESLVDGHEGSKRQIDSRPGTPQASDSAYRRDPFEEESSFEENLSDGLLSECPTGSSTPKTMTLTPRLHRIDEDDDDFSTYSKPEHAGLYAHDAGSSPDVFASHTEVAVMEPRHGDRRVKKHPSPSKKTLEDLEVAFAMYARLKTLESGDEVDELAKDSLGALSFADHNKVIRHGAKPKVVESAHRTDRRGAYRIRHSLPFRPGLKNNQDIDELGD